ncbi:MAG: extracellular solute-binding protein [Chloroflexota bacterium]|nr:extracellular solute-binding protein [Chloroflexota bacterium]
MTLALRTSRRHLLTALAGLGVAGALSSRSTGQEDTNSEYRDTISVLAPVAPDPAPPDAETDLDLGLEFWQERNRARINLESAALENIRPKILMNFQRGAHLHDVMYCAGWAQEIAQHLHPVDALLGPGTRADISPWAFNSFRWQGKTYGVPIVSNPFILFGNRTLLNTAGIDNLPSTWDELISAARAVHLSGKIGWAMPAGQIGGLGGLFSSWQVFFLQAGGELFDPDGRPLFASDAGIAAIQMLQELLPYSDPAALRRVSLLDASVPMLHGEAALMANWAVMYRSFSNPALSRISDSVITAPLPDGPIGTASIDSGDGWTIDIRTWVAGKSMSYIRFLLEPRTQLHLYARSGWLPASLSALDDEALLAVAPHAQAVRQQVRHRIESGFRPDFDAVSAVIGTAVRSALTDGVAPITALRTARDQIARAAR